MKKIKTKALGKVLNKLDEKLSAKQLKFLEAGRWFVGGGRQTGRSYLLALCYIEKALQNLGMSIEVCDHAQDGVHNHNIMRIIESILCKYPAIYSRCTLAKTWFRIGKMKKVNARDINIRRTDE